MKVLVINAGSSSIKYQLIGMTDEKVIAKGIVERIGLKNTALRHQSEGCNTVQITVSVNNHEEAIHLIIATLTDKQYGAINDISEIFAIGHRIAHGGEKMYDSAIINNEVLDAIKKCIELAPLHNPANVQCIEACRKVMPGLPMAAIFDTAFHQTLPSEAFMYAIPYEYYLKYGIRRYGFHGTSHKYVAKEAARLIGKSFKSIRIITCHLGNGSSIAAIKNGKSVDTSMGFTPVDGLMMGTRSGSIDPCIISFLAQKEDISLNDINDLLNKKSGFLGLSGSSSDFRDLYELAICGNERALMTINAFCYQIKKYIGSYAAAMGGVDCVVFTAGIGENTVYVRERVCADLTFLGIEIDQGRNEKLTSHNKSDGEISTDNSIVKVYVIHTNEELMIARETVTLLNL